MSDFHDTQWWQHVYTQAPVAIGIYIGEKHEIAFANPKMLNIWGRTDRQVLHKPLFEALPEVAKQGFEEVLAEVLHTGKPFFGNDLPATLHRDGKLELTYFNIHYEPLRNDQGNIYGIIQTATEVTKLVEARQQAERDEEILKAALQAGKMGTWFVDLVHQTFVRSPEFDTILGDPQRSSAWHKDEIIRMVAAEDQPVIEKYLREGYQDSSLDYELRLQRADGSLRHVAIKGKTSYNLKGDPISVSGVIMDVTEQKLAAEKERQLAAEQAARQEAEHQREALKDLFMEAPALICTLHGPNHVMDLVNVQMRQLFQERHLQGKPLLEAIPELKGQPILDTLNRVFQTGELLKGIEVPVKIDPYNTGNLEMRYFNVVFQPRHHVGQQVNGILVFAYDVTARKTSEEELLRLTHELALSNQEIQSKLKELSLTNEQLTRTNADLDNFIYTASHDLKAPISNIEGLTDTLRRNIGNTGAHLDIHLFQKIVTMIQASIDRFKRTVKELTDIAQTQKGLQETSQIFPIDIIHEVIEDLQPVIRQHDVKVDVDECARTSFQFSHKNFTSIVHNLLSNAIKFSVPGRRPVVKVRCLQQAGWQVLEVEDNGLGISEADLHKIFLMFKRVHAHIDGSGVGLYLVKRIVDNAGGEITVESQENAGTKFTVMLPLGA